MGNDHSRITNITLSRLINSLRWLAEIHVDLITQCMYMFVTFNLRSLDSMG